MRMNGKSLCFKTIRPDESTIYRLTISLCTPKSYTRVLRLLDDKKKAGMQIVINQ